MPQIDDGQSGDLEAAWAGFEAPAAWKRSQKGNRWRDWLGRRCVIFRRRDGFGWCYTDDEWGTCYGEDRHETEDAARLALGEALGVGW